MEWKGVGLRCRGQIERKEVKHKHWKRWITKNHIDWVIYFYLFIKERMHSDAKGPFCLLLLITLWQMTMRETQDKSKAYLFWIKAGMPHAFPCHKKENLISTTIIIILVDYSEMFHDFIRFGSGVVSRVFGWNIINFYHLIF